MTKRELRKIYLEKRLQLTEAEYDNLSQRICRQFFNRLDLTNVKVVHLFLPIKKNKEPNTWFITERLRSDYPTIKISIPKIVDEQLFNYYLDSDCILEENKWGISEPIKGNLTESKEIDLVLVPLLAFDKENHRVGYGKGYYDRFLKQCRTDSKKIGLSFFHAVEKIDDVNEHDLALDAFIIP